MHNQAVVPESQLTDLVAPAVVDVTLEVAAAVLGMTWEAVVAGPGGKHLEDNSAEAQSVAAVNTLHHRVNNITSYHTR